MADRLEVTRPDDALNSETNKLLEKCIAERMRRTKKLNDNRRQSLHKSVHDLLVAALRVLREKGWHRGALFSKTGAVCALGAMGHADHRVLTRVSTLESDMHRKAQELLLEVIREHVPAPPWFDSHERWRGIAQFNDVDSTTFKDVEEVFEKAIAKAGERGI